MNDELLLVRLLLGFFRFKGSFAGTGASKELPAPKAGAFPDVLFECG